MANVAWKFDMIPTLRPLLALLYPPPPPPTALCHSRLFRFSSLPKVSPVSRNPDNIYAHIIHGILSMISKSKTKFGMERVCIHEPTMLYSGRYKVRKEPSPAKRCEKSEKGAKRAMFYRRKADSAISCI